MTYNKIERLSKIAAQADRIHKNLPDVETLARTQRIHENSPAPEVLNMIEQISSLNLQNNMYSSPSYQTAFEATNRIYSIIPGLAVNAALAIQNTYASWWELESSHFIGNKNLSPHVDADKFSKNLEIVIQEEPESAKEILTFIEHFLEVTPNDADEKAYSEEIKLVNKYVEDLVQWYNDKTCNNISFPRINVIEILKNPLFQSAIGILGLILNAYCIYLTSR